MNAVPVGDRPVFLTQRTRNAMAACHKKCFIAFGRAYRKRISIQ
jgi:hypothetical protein